VGLILWRRNRGELKDEHPFVSVFSRESLFVLNNVIFVALFVAIFWGSFGAPIISEIFMGTDITLGSEYFTRVTPPLFLALYILMGIAPLSAWGAGSLARLGKSVAVPAALAVIVVLALTLTGTPLAVALLGYGIVSFAGFVALYEIYRGAAARRRSVGENWLNATTGLFARNRRRYGGYIIHLGVTIIGIGVIGSTIFKQETQQTLQRGESLQIAGYAMRYDSYTPALADDGRTMQIANVTVSRDGQELATLRPRHDIYPAPEGTDPMTMTIAGQYSTVAGDFYVLMVGGDSSSATFKVYINPLVNFVWWGGLVLILGTFIAMWKGEPLPARVREPQPVDGLVGARA
jgi:cytochrome c-type biogenesis protein CcmF